jgi:hypothetical protein
MIESFDFQLASEIATSPEARRLLRSSGVALARCAIAIEPASGLSRTMLLNVDRPGVPRTSRSVFGLVIERDLEAKAIEWPAAAPSSMIGHSDAAAQFWFVFSRPERRRDVTRVARRILAKIDGPAANIRGVAA